jgi:hypothetical protein
MTADVEKDDLLRGDQQGEGDAVAVGEPHGMAAGEAAGEGMQAEGGLEGVVLKVGQELGEAGLEVGVVWTKSKAPGGTRPAGVAFETN